MNENRRNSSLRLIDFLRSEFSGKDFYTKVEISKVLDTAEIPLLSKNTELNRDSSGRIIGYKHDEN